MKQKCEVMNVAEDTTSNEQQLIDEKLSRLTKKESPISSEHQNTNELIGLVNKLTKYEVKEKTEPAEWNFKHRPNLTNREIVKILKQIVENKHQKDFIERSKDEPTRNNRVYYISNPQVLKEFEKSLKNTGSGHNSYSVETYDERLLNLVDEMKRRHFDVDEAKSPFRQNEIDDVINEKKLALRQGLIKPKIPEDIEDSANNGKEVDIENEWGVTKIFSWANIHSSQEAKNPTKIKKSQNLKKLTPDTKIKTHSLVNIDIANKWNTENVDVIGGHKINSTNKLKNENKANKWDSEDTTDINKIKPNDILKNENIESKRNLEDADVTEVHKIKTYNQLKHKYATNKRGAENANVIERHKIKSYNKLKHEATAKKWNTEDAGVTERHKLKTYNKKRLEQKDAWSRNENEELGSDKRHKTRPHSNDWYKNRKKTTKIYLNDEDDYHSIMEGHNKYDYDDYYRPPENRPRDYHREARYRPSDDEKPVRNIKNRYRSALYGRTPPPSKGKRGINET